MPDSGTHLLLTVKVAEKDIHEMASGSATSLADVSHQKQYIVVFLLNRKGCIHCSIAQADQRFHSHQRQRTGSSDNSFPRQVFGIETTNASGCNGSVLSGCWVSCVDRLLHSYRSDCYRRFLQEEKDGHRSLKRGEIG